MSAVRDLTPEQQAAISTRDVSIALSAGAGCGKTFVLTERFLSHLEPNAAGVGPIELGELVAFTYTDRAAREMRDRIRAKCRERLAAADDRAAPYWLSLLRQLDTARVSTIHAFCAAFLRSHAVEAAIDPRFEQLDGPQIQTLLWELTDDALRRRLEAHDENTIDLAVHYGLSQLRSRIVSLLRHPDRDEFQKFSDYTPQRLVACWRSAVNRVRDPLVADFPAGAPLAAMRDYLRTHTFQKTNLQNHSAAIAAALATITPGADLQETLSPLVATLHLKNLWQSFRSEGLDYRDYSQRVTALRDAANEIIALTLDIPACPRAAEFGLKMLAIARDVSEAYAREKQSLGFLDYDDLIHKTLRVLTASEHRELRRQVARRIHLLLVDESQDAGPAQKELIDALCDDQTNDGKLFLVGDYKQSIYRFLGARPRLFHERRGQLPERGRLPLSLNFRSQPAILDFVNALFAAEFAGNYEPLAPCREQLSARPAVEFLWATPPVSNDPAAAKKKWRAPDLRRLEADWIARRLAGLIESAEPLIPDSPASSKPPRLRGMRPGDVAILFRTLGDVQYYEEALRRYDLPYYLVGGRAFHAQQEIYDLVNLLSALTSPCDEIGLAGALRSPLFNVPDEAIYALVEQSGSLAAALFAPGAPAGLSAEDRRRVEFAAATIADLRACKDRLPIADLVRRAIDLTGYDASLLAEFLGERKLANLHKLVDMARACDRSGVASLADFVVQLRESVAEQPHEAPAATESEAGDIIRLMTIHQAKGLEFPVVVVADCERPPRNQPSSACFDPELGPLVSLPPRLDEKEPFTGYRFYNRNVKREDDEEAIRLLYVAVTRAADYLILSAACEDPDKLKGQWSKYVAERFEFTTGKCLDAAIHDDAKPLVRVTMMIPSPDLKPSEKHRGPNLGALADRVAALAESQSPLLDLASAPIAPDLSARRVFSFSRLKDAFVAEPERIEPLAAEEESAPRMYSALDLGTLVHAVLEALPWPKASTSAIAALVDRKLDQLGGVNDDLAAAANKLVAGLVASPLGHEIAAARRRRAEVEFLLAWPPDAAKKSAAVNESAKPPILHGFLDCLFEDDQGGWHVVDYKSNHIQASDVPRAAADYELQMLLYGLAAEAVLDKPPASLRLFFLKPAVEHRFPWNAAARKNAVVRITAALPVAAIHP